MAVFNDIRKVLVDPSQNGQDKRRQIVTAAALIKGYAGLAMGGTGLISIVSLLARRSFPFIGGIFALLSAAGVIASRETMVVARNVEGMTKGDGPLGNAVARGSAAWSKSAFMTRVTQDTWVVGPLFGSSIEAELRDS